MAYDELTKAVTVSEANRLIKEALDVSFYQIVIKGEISGFRPSSSGHAYFDLKDRDASIPSCIFKSALYGMFKFQNGDLVTATGRISLWEKTGKLTFIITKMVKQGDGELQALIEKRKLYYQNLGWFDPAIKRPLPENITRVGVVTSATGAVIHDILDVTRRRAPSLDILLFPCAVQGAGAEITIASRIRQANNFDACDVLIVGRGGGSAEDLAPFSEDDVIIAIHESHIPVISAVGHEVDWALSDYVADVRAGTPSIAAEKVTATIYNRRQSYFSIMDTIQMLMKSKVLENEKKIPSVLYLDSLMKRKLSEAKNRIKRPEDLEETLLRKCQNAEFRLSMAEETTESSMKNRLKESKQLLLETENTLMNILPGRIKDYQEELKSLKKFCRLHMENKLGIKKEEIKTVRKEVEALSPLAVLSRGYAVVTKEDGSLVTKETDVEGGENLTIRLHKGTIKSTVIKEKEHEL